MTRISRVATPSLAGVSHSNHCPQHVFPHIHDVHLRIYESTSSWCIYHRVWACCFGFDTNGHGVIATLPGHDEEITVVKAFSDTFVTGDKLGHVKIWRKRASHSWRAHKEPISALSIFRSLILTGSSDATLKSWYRTQDETGDKIDEGQTIDLKRRYPLDIAVSSLPGSSALIIAVATTSRVIDVYLQASGQEIVFALSLEGHEDWIRALSFSPFSPESDDPSLTLASGGQDNYIRLWLIKPTVPKPVSLESTDPTDPTDELLDAFERSLNEVGLDEPGRQLSIHGALFLVRDKADNRHRAVTYSLSFDALLVGHEASVNSVSWKPGDSGAPQLLSSSTDASLIIWEPIDSGAGAIWGSVQRFGDVGGQRAGGFIGALWIDSTGIAGWGWHGGWRRWQRSSNEQEAWSEINAPTGHYGPVRGLAWSPEGEYIVSTSQDQTTRIHGPVGASRTWHELARPQVHGYDLTDAAFVGPGALRLVSSAEEKIARVFDAPKGFVRAIRSLGTVQWGDEQADELEQAARPIGASLPPLGLSNKATDKLESSNEDMSLPQAPTRPPFDSELATITLWPETEKLFGHGYELHTLAVSPSGSLVATACRATSANHAVVRLHASSNWQPIGKPLSGHSLTITRIAFSHDERMILSASRDRSWRLFRQIEGSQGEYEPVADNASHGRIIWDCAWSTDDKIFATASRYVQPPKDEHVVNPSNTRDKTVRIWSGSEADLGKALSTIKLKEAATAVALTEYSQKRILAIGLENGHVHLYISALDAPDKWASEATFDSSVASVGHVHRLAWRPGCTNPQQLAMCSEDRTMRVLDVYFK
ncbi:elongator complex protein 2 [Rhizoctonia solani AG-1 IA]|uniref:Elongator complex protein 2 n=1 Tax=Thanatephorus cucumeris (strain AG1-IA) TaxID=983506 RepID=L8WXP6_THACA|nr:elongator complex protein 2 [Rhizoctonia solani AG-1 IA]